MRDLQRDFGSAIIMITHNLGAVSQMADHVTVMYLGRVIEYAAAADVFHNPLHPYTVGLLDSASVWPQRRKSTGVHQRHGTHAH
jgi:ABC-type dipeptide/oligopeptide/nickel transport system ATPase component